MSQIKDCIRSRFEHGYLAEMDLSQIEIVVLAWLSQDANLIQDLVDGIDFHCKRVSQTLNMPYDTVFSMYHTGDKEITVLRKKAKQFSFQRSYGASAKAISKSTGLDITKVYAMIRAEDDMYPDVAKLHVRNSEEVNANKVAENGGLVGYLSTSHGKHYKFKFYDGATRPPITKVMNYPVQGTAADIMKILLILTHSLLKKRKLNYDILLVNTIHDAIMFDIRNDNYTVELRDVCDTVMHQLPTSLSDYFRTEWNVPIEYSLSFGRRWSDIK